MATLAAPNLSGTGTTAAGVTVTNNLDLSHATGFPVLTQTVQTVSLAGSGSGPGVGYAI